jgi:hypothetical protein
MHDMVNQKLGKVCISYEKLRKKHAVATMTVSDFGIFDVLAITCISCRDSDVRARKFADVMAILTRLLSVHPKYLRVPALLAGRSFAPRTVQQDLLDVKNELLRPFGAQQTMDAFVAQYMQASSDAR